MTATRWLLLFSLSTLFFTACPGPQKSPSEIEEEHNAINQHTLIKGMGSESVIASLGKPDRVTTSKEGKMVIEQWSYASGSSVTFTDGIVSGFRLGPAAATPKRGEWMFKNYKNPLEQRPRSHH